MKNATAAFGYIEKNIINAYLFNYLIKCNKSFMEDFMFKNLFTYLLIFIFLASCSFPVFATDSVYVWSDGVIDEAISTSALVR